MNIIKSGIPKQKKKRLIYFLANKFFCVKPVLYRNDKSETQLMSRF